MSKLSRLLIASLIALLVGIAVPAQATAPDATLFTQYAMFSNFTTVDWTVCGSTLETSGCYASGSLGPFGKIGAMIEGYPKVSLKTNTVTRNIYVLDVAGGNSQNQVLLYVYKKTDVVSPTSDTVTLTLSKTVTLPLAGGTSVAASMAANKLFLFAGTNQSTTAVRIQKSNLTVTQTPGFSPLTVSAVTADQYGYVSVAFGSFSGGQNGFYLFGPDGNLQESGGGASFLLSTEQALLPSTLP